LTLIHIPFFFFFHDTATTEIYTLSLHDALPISSSHVHAMYTTEAMYDLVSLHHHCTCSIWANFDLHAFIEHDTLRTSYLRYHQYKNTVLEGLSDDKQRAVSAVSLLTWIEYLPVHILSCLEITR